jgi:hypothetical protein
LEQEGAAQQLKGGVQDERVRDRLFWHVDDRRATGDELGVAGLGDRSGRHGGDGKTSSSLEVKRE